MAEEILLSERAAQLAKALDGVFYVEQIRIQAQPQAGIELRGRLLIEADSAYPLIRDRFALQGYLAFLSQAGETHIIQAVEKQEQPQATRVWINLALFLLTAASTLLTGAWMEGADLLARPAELLRGAPFAFTVLAILGTHEMGHYIVARRHRADVSLPYFIPLPFPLSLFGTLGAVIVQRSPFEDRKALFDVGVAGPLAGLTVALPLLVFGLITSNVQPYTLQEGSFFEGNSLLYLGLKYLVHGRLLPFNGLDVYLSPVAFAAWFGLLVTFFNLFPIGQLDGGHVLYALVGPRAWPVAEIAARLLQVVGGLGLIGLLFQVSFLTDLFWPGWFIWGLLARWVGTQHPPPLNDVSRLGAGRQLLGLGVIVLFCLLFMRTPLNSTPALF